MPEWITGLITTVVGAALGLLASSGLAEWKAKKAMEKRDAEEAEKKNADYKGRAIEAYTNATVALMPEVKRLRNRREWNEEAEKAMQARAIELAESDMPKELYEWMESNLANPQAFKERYVDAAVQANKMKLEAHHG